jgi:uncharacterized protein (TIGR02679 family)
MNDRYKEALTHLNSNEIFKKIFKEIYKKYKIYGRIAGSFTIEGKTPEEIKLLQPFDIRVLQGGKAQIKSSQVEELFINRFGKIDFEKLMKEFLKVELKTTKELKEEKNKRKIQFFEDVLQKSKDGLGKKWFTDMISGQKYGYGIFTRAYEKSQQKGTEELKEKLLLIINCINNLPYLNNEFTNISIFAATYTKDPHFFDGDNLGGKLLIHGIAYVLNIETPQRVEEMAECFYKVGLLKDEISNTTVISSIIGYKGGKEVKVTREFYEWNEPMHISLANLTKIDKFKCKNNCVYIFENPAVFHEIQKRTLNTKPSIICTSGQLNLSSYILIDKLKDEVQTIYYAGDFDPEGIQIAYKLKMRYGDKLILLGYNVEQYNLIKSNRYLDDKRISKLDGIDHIELNPLINEIKKHRVAAYQELLIEMYMKEFEILK